MAHEDEVRWLDEREARAWRSLQFMDMQLTAALARQLAAESGLSYPDYVVLVALTGRPDGRRRVFELARDLGWEKSRVSHHVARMAERGLVVATAAGLRAAAAAVPVHDDVVRRQFLGQVSERELATISRVALRVTASLADSRSRSRGSWR